MDPVFRPLSAAEASAPGKVILCGEHSVVYGQPAIAAPVSALRAQVRVLPGPLGMGLEVVAPDVGQRVRLAEAAADDPLVAVPRALLSRHDLAEPDGRIEIRSALPIASGLGSGAAVAVAMARALLLALDLPPELEEVSALAFEAEKLHHGTPSGIDQTVITWEAPIFFVRGTPPQRLSLGAPVDLLIAHSGVAASTRELVSGVRLRAQADPATYTRYFAQMGELALAAREALAAGELERLGQLFDRNHELLQAIGVSHPRLEALVNAARQAGALGAKLTGAGGGGNIISLITPDKADMVRAALLEAGAAQVWSTRLEA